MEVIHFFLFPDIQAELVSTIGVSQNIYFHFVECAFKYSNYIKAQKTHKEKIGQDHCEFI